MEVSGHLHAPAALSPGERYPLDKSLGGSQKRSGRGGEEKEIPSADMPGIESRSSSP
jgi:hypothetical protein